MPGRSASPAVGGAEAVHRSHPLAGLAGLAAHCEPLAEDDLTDVAGIVATYAELTGVDAVFAARERERIQARGDWPTMPVMRGDGTVTNQQIRIP